MKNAVSEWIDEALSDEVLRRQADEAAIRRDDLVRTLEGNESRWRVCAEMDFGELRAYIDEHLHRSSKARARIRALHGIITAAQPVRTKDPSAYPFTTTRGDDLYA